MQDDSQQDVSMYFSASRANFYPVSLREQYQANGRWPDDAVEVSDEDWHTYGQGEPPEGMQRGADENGMPTWVPIPPPALPELAKRKRGEIDDARDSAFAAGLEYDFDGETDVIQTRPQDQINLLGLSAKAQRLIAAGQPEATLSFRGRSNLQRTLTAEQMDAMTMAALAHLEEIFQRSWARKDAIEVALKAEEREGIEAVVW